MTGTIFNIQKFCVNDGPGIRTTVFLKGCPLKCIWCHNPESQAAVPEILFYAEKCTGCGRCKALTLENKNFVCFHGAKEVCGKEMCVAEILEEVLKDKIFYDNSGGGMTLSGGEPFYQFEFSLALLKAAKEKGVHTAVETCGYTSKERLMLAAHYTDVFLFDFKETQSLLHKKFTGVGNENILKNLRLLNTLNKQIILRCPIIPGYNDRKEHFEGICAVANEFEHILAVELEAYHSLGENKYEALGKKSLKISPPDEDTKALWIDSIFGKCRKPVRWA